MRKLIIFFIAFILGNLQASGQGKNTLLQRINEIKSQVDVYFWDQYTHPDADTAKINSVRRLLIDVKNIGKDGQELSVSDIIPHISFISIDRGNLKQYFAYIKKTDAASVWGEKFGTPSTSTTTENVHEPKSIVSPAKKEFVPEAFTVRLMEAKTFMNVYKLLKYLKSRGQVLQFGSLKDVEDYSSFDLALFDLKSQEIITLLSPTTANGKRINKVNGSEDSLANYPSELTAIIWYIKK